MYEATIFLVGMIAGTWATIVAYLLGRRVGGRSSPSEVD